MTLAPIATLVSASTRPTFQPLFRAALRRLSWRTAGTALAIACTLQAWNMLETELLVSLHDDVIRDHAGRALINLLMAFSTLVATLVADEAVERGARRLPAYVCAVVAGSAIAAAAHMPLRAWLGMSLVYMEVELGALGQAILVFLQYQLWAGVIVVVYVNRRTALQAAARMNAARLERARAARNALESRLQALQARIEPRFLSGSLQQVRDFYRTDAERGRRLLDDFIAYLRAALPQMRDCGSTLERELSLASAYLAVRLAHARRDAFSVSADPRLLDAAVPPMMLVPIVGALLADAGRETEADSIRISAAREAQDLELVVHRRGPMVASRSAGSLLSEVASRLHMLHGARGCMTYEPANDGVRVSLRLPYDPPHRDHR